MHAGCLLPSRITRDQVSLPLLWCETRPLFPHLFLWLSRACLGKTIVCIYIYVCSSKRAFLAGDDTLIVSSLLMGMLGSFLLIDSSPGENENEKNAICTVSALLFILKVITLPRQARDKHRKSGETSAFFSSAGDPEATLLPLPRFIAGFALITIAFPFGRTSVMGCFSKVLGPTPQGAWVGVLLAVGAVPRIIGPWWSLFALGK